MDKLVTQEIQHFIDNNIKTLAQEMCEFSESGILRDGLIRNLAKQLNDQFLIIQSKFCHPSDTSYIPHEGLTIALTLVKDECVKKIANL